MNGDVRPRPCVSNLNHLIHTLIPIMSITELYPSITKGTLVVSVLGLLLLALFFWSPSAKGKAPRLPDTIPHVTNTIQYLTDAGRFLDRVT